MKPSRYDKLTGLLSPGPINQAVVEAVRRAGEEGAEFALIFFSVDLFHNLNHEFGFDAGDRTLVRLTRAFEEVIPGSWTWGRYSGDTFLAIMPSGEEKAVIAMAEKIRAAAAAAPKGDLPDYYPVTVSVGAASFMPGDDWNEIMRRADYGVFFAKRADRNVVVYNRYDSDRHHNFAPQLHRVDPSPYLRRNWWKAPDPD